MTRTNPVPTHSCPWGHLRGNPVPFDEPAVLLLRDLLLASENILVTTHLHPDGDAVGSLLGSAGVIRALGKTVTAHTPDAPPSFLRFLPWFDTITHAPSPTTEYDLVLALDHSELSRTGLADELLEGTVPVAAIDHHATADRRATVVLVVPEASATCELLAQLFPKLGLFIDAATATCLLTGIVTDTGSFQHANTSARALATAAALLEAGADFRAIIGGVFGGRTLPALKIMGRTLERLQANQATGAVLSFVTENDLRECGATLDDLAGVVNLLNTIPEARFSLLLTEYEQGRLKGSLRSEPRTRTTGSLRDEPAKSVDVSAIARRFGGGGHTLASGFEVAGRLVRDEHGWRIE